MNPSLLQLCYLDGQNHARQTEELAVPYGVEIHHIVLVASVVWQHLLYYHLLLQSSKSWDIKPFFRRTSFSPLPSITHN